MMMVGPAPCLRLVEVKRDTYAQCRFAAGHEGKCEPFVSTEPIPAEDLHRAKQFVRDSGWVEGRELPAGAIRVECIEVSCDECEQLPEVDGGWPHFNTDSDLAHELGNIDWHIVNGRVLCFECASRAENGQERPQP